ncbi:hypothetical protein V8F20_009609 [Naviculisporaceae sp. PSN 640]
MPSPQQEDEAPPPSGQGKRGAGGQANRDPGGGGSGRSIRPFDPWNSSSTGHQRAETRGPQGWRESRVAKLHSQFRAGHSGGERMSDRVGAGSADFDERLGMLVPQELRARAMNSVADMLRNPGTMRQRHGSTSTPERSCSPEKSEVRSRPGSSLGPGSGPLSSRENANTQHLGERGNEGESAEESKKEQEEPQQERKIFDGLVIYINGSTHPVISDHKLKRVLAENGAHTSIHLGRRQVTHVILGKPSGPTGGAGGGLAGGKLEKEIRRIGGCGIKYVSVEWVLESLKAGKRLPEARFANLKVAARGQQSVLGAFSKKG